MSVTGWIDQRDTSLPLAKGEAIRQVMAAIDAAGIAMPNTTYRIEMAGTSAAQIEAKPGKAPKGQLAAPSEALSEDSVGTQDAALDRLVEDERNDPEAPDLLDDTAPRE